MAAGVGSMGWVLGFVCACVCLPVEGEQGAECVSVHVCVLGCGADYGYVLWVQPFDSFCPVD